MVHGCYVRNDLLGFRDKSKVVDIDVNMMNHINHHVGLLSFKKVDQPKPGFKIWLAWIK